jgi:hypothetical protein
MPWWGKKQRATRDKAVPTAAVATNAASVATDSVVVPHHANTGERLMTDTAGAAGFHGGSVELRIGLIGIETPEAHAEDLAQHLREITRPGAALTFDDTWEAYIARCAKLGRQSHHWRAVAPHLATRVRRDKARTVPDTNGMTRRVTLYYPHSPPAARRLTPGRALRMAR